MSGEKPKPGPVDLAEVADALRALLVKVEEGELTGSATLVARLEGAVLALEALTSEPE